MQGHRLPATLEVTGSNPGPGKINLIKIEKTSMGFPILKKRWTFLESAACNVFILPVLVNTLQ